MAASITQNLPRAAATSARSAGRQTASSDDKLAQGAQRDFDAALKQSFKRQSTARRDDAAAADQASADTARAQKQQGTNKREVDRAEGAPPVEAVAPGTATEDKAPDAAAESTGQPPGEPAVADDSTDAAPNLPDAAVDDGANQQVANTATNLTAGVPAAAQGDAAVVPAGEPLPEGEAGVDSLQSVAGRSTAATPQATNTNDSAQLEPESQRAGLRPGELPADGAPGEAAVAGNQAAAPRATKLADPEPDAAPQAPADAIADVAAEPIVAKPIESDAARAAAVPQSPQAPGVKADAAVAPQVPAQQAPAPERFAESNHQQIVNAVRGQLLPNGGTMQIRLDPPELGALFVQVSMRNGVMDASFQTDNANATQALSHSLTQLKHSLESQGVTVDKLQVSQAPRSERTDQQNDSKNGQQQGQQGFDWERHSNQQRKEMLKRMWAKLGAGDPLDLVA